MMASRPPASPVPALPWARPRRAAAAALALLSGNTIFPRDIAVEKSLQQALQQQGAFIGRGQAMPEGL